ncbi:MAG: OmpA family protein, partial [Rhodobacterales bacterium]|nr:OmpA family protein [Rhodobacterales bacterium]
MGFAFSIRAVSVLVFLGLVVTGCKKKVEPPPPPPPQPVQVRLQVTSISPGVIAPNTPAAAKVYGSAFEAGATVNFVEGGAGNEVQALDGNTLSVRIPGLAVGTYDVEITNPGGETSTLRQGLTVKVLELSCKSATVNFAYDQAGLTSAAKSTLSSHGSCYQSEAGNIRIEGHADERGTVDYNLALGQRRADSVKRSLTGSGVSGSKISTVSLGE